MIKMRYAKYLAFKCNVCKRWNGRENHEHIDAVYSDGDIAKKLLKIRLTCKYCNKIINFKHKDVYGANVAHEWFDDAKKMQSFISERNEVGEKKLW